MKKTWLNFYVDLFLFLDFIMMMGTGLVIKYVLPPGSGGRHGGERHVKALLSMTRHEWGDIHFYLSILLITLITIHIILHWKWIKCMFKDLTEKFKK